MINTTKGIRFSFSYGFVYKDGVYIQIKKLNSCICTFYPNAEDGATTFTSVCHPNDRFEKDKGRKLALKRALKYFDIDKETRKQVWQDYFLNCGPRERYTALYVTRRAAGDSRF